MSDIYTNYVEALYKLYQNLDELCQGSIQIMSGIPYYDHINETYLNLISKNQR